MEKSKGTLPVLNKEGKTTDRIDLPEAIFSDRLNKSVIYQAITMYHANFRQGLASTKQRGAVRGGGKKPWRQKGTGRARAGSTRSPLWRGGGVVFGPHPREFNYTVPKKIKLAALRETLNAKFQAKTLICVDELKEKFTKTKEFAKILAVLKINGNVLALMDGCHESLYGVSRNIPHLALMRADDVNALDILSHKTLLLTKTAFNKLLKRL